MPYKDPEKARQYNTLYKKKWIGRNRERWEKYMEKWREENKDKIRGYSRSHYWRNREKEIIRVMEGNKRRYRRLRLEAIEQYGGKCVCCGEGRIQFLCIDHIHGGGGKHRGELWKKHLTIYEFLKKENYPDAYRVLCHNCNMSIGFYGYCPHQVESGEITEIDLVEIEITMTEKKKRKGQNANVKVKVKK